MFEVFLLSKVQGGPFNVLVLAVIHYPIDVPQGKEVGKEETDTIFWWDLDIQGTSKLSSKTRISLL